MPKHPIRPHRNTYWVEPGKILAGEYPGDLYEKNGRRKLESLLDAGVRVFIDLTHPADGMVPYADMVQSISDEMGVDVTYHSFPIPDLSVPESDDAMRKALDAIDAAVEAGVIPYVHCWGGIGRTGTTIGCYLVRQGLEPDEALREVQRRYGAMEKRIVHPMSPQTDEQVAYVRAWKD